MSHWSSTVFWFVLYVQEKGGFRNMRTAKAKANLHIRTIWSAHAQPAYKLITYGTVD